MRHKYVTFGAPGVGSVTILQDHNFLPHMAVIKINPQVGPILSPAQAPLYWAPELHQTFQGNRPGNFKPILGLWGGGCPSPKPPTHAVMA